MSMRIKVLLASAMVVATFAVAQAQQPTTPEGDYIPQGGGYGGYGGNGYNGSGPYNGSYGNYGGGYGTYNGGNGPYGSQPQYGYAPNSNYGYGGGYYRPYYGGSGYGGY
jgi:hypothetical protein